MAFFGRDIIDRQKSQRAQGRKDASYARGGPSFAETRRLDWETDEEYQHRMGALHSVTRPQLLNKAVTYNPNPTSGFFAPVSSNNNQYLHAGNSVSLPRSFVSIDIETDDSHKPIAISAIKYYYNQDTGKFETVDSYQRYYKFSQLNVKNTQDVHGLTPEGNRELRRQMGAFYPTTYGLRERSSLESFIGDSVVFGHNIHSFDLQNLRLRNIISSIDTLGLAATTWPGRKNDLDTVFKRLYGVTMEQYGLSHHDANADTIANALILQKIMQMPSFEGQAARFVAQTRNFHVVEYDEYLKSMIVKGDYRTQFHLHGKPLGDAYMTVQELKNKGLMDGEGNLVPGYHYDNATEQLANELKDIKNNLRVTGDSTLGIQSLTDSLRAHAFWRKRQLAEKLSQRDSSTWDDYLGDFGFGPSESGSLKDMAARLQASRRVEQNELLNIRKNYVMRRLERRGQLTDDLVARIAKAPDRNELSDILDEAAVERQRIASEIRLQQKGERWIRQTEMHGGYVSSVDKEAIRGAKSMDDLAQAIDKASIYSDKFTGSLMKLSKSKPYDPNQYVASFANQLEGIYGASHGAVPSFISRPIYRMGKAFVNSMQESLAMPNAYQRIYKALGGGATTTGQIVGGLLKGSMGRALGGGVQGLVNAYTQVEGNLKQGAMEKAGYAIQNNLNTLGAISAYLATPFQALYKAVKLCIGGFGGLWAIMSRGLSSLQGMGNPITELTGSNYTGYQGTTMVDAATLSSAGTLNSIVESFGTRRQLLYTMGEYDKDRIVASAMLGQFSNVYGAGANAQGDYMSMAQDLLDRVRTESPAQQARTFALMTKIDQGLANLVHSANLLNVANISDLMDPTKRGMYWRPLSDEGPNSEVKRMRWASYEYQAARGQFDNSKRRIATSLWEGGGKDIYNTFNKLLDAAAGGQWSTVVDRAIDIWDTFKKKFTEIWDGFNKNSEFKARLELVGIRIAKWALGVAQKIISIWDQVVLKVAEKIQGLVAYLSTVKVGLVKEDDGSYRIGISSAFDENAVTSRPMIPLGGQYMNKKGELLTEHASIYDANVNPFAQTPGISGAIGTFFWKSRTGLDGVRVGDTTGTWDRFDITDIVAGLRKNYAGKELNFGAYGVLGVPEADAPEEVWDAYTRDLARLSVSNKRDFDAALYLSESKKYLSGLKYSGMIPNVVKEFQKDAGAVSNNVLGTYQRTLEERENKLLIEFRGGKTGDKTVIDTGTPGVLEANQVRWLQDLFPMGLSVAYRASQMNYGGF